MKPRREAMANELIRIVTDMDGVIAHSQEPILRTANKRFGTSLKYEQLTHHGIILEEAVRLSGEAPEVVAAWLFSAEVMSQSSPVPGSQKAVNNLHHAVTIDVATGRPGEQRDVSTSWTSHHFPKIQGVHLRNPGDVEKADEFKGRMLQELLGNVYLEDDPRAVTVVLAMVQSGLLPNLQRILLMDRPWNSGYAVQRPVYRVGNWRKKNFGWNEVVRHIRELQNG